MQPEVKILILNWNQKDLLEKCIKSVLSINYSNYQIIVIDNASSDGSIESVKRKFPSVDIIKLRRNYHFSGGYNKFFKNFNNKSNFFCLLLNNDTIVDPNILTSFNNARKLKGDHHIYGAKIFYYNNPNLLWYAGGKINQRYGLATHYGIRKTEDYSTDQVILTDYVTGCCLFTSAKVIKQLNGFDEKFNMYGEDVDFCIRAKIININSYYCPEAKLWHHVSASLGGSASIKKIIRKTKSIFRLYYKHYR